MVKDTSVGDSGSDHCSLGCPGMPVEVVIKKVNHPVDETFQVGVYTCHANPIVYEKNGVLFATHGILIIGVFS